MKKTITAWISINGNGLEVFWAEKGQGIKVPHKNKREALKRFRQKYNLKYKRLEIIDEAQRRRKTMKKYELICSVDAVNIDYSETIDEATAMNWWKCNNIAEKHGCSFWSVEEWTE